MWRAMKGWTMEYGKLSERDYDIEWIGPDDPPERKRECPRCGTEYVVIMFVDDPESVPCPVCDKEGE